MLQRLREFAEDGHIDLPPLLYSWRPVRYIIDLDYYGRPLAPAPVDTSESGGRWAHRGTLRLVPSLSRSKGIRPLLLADNAEYTLGIARAGSRSDRVATMHAKYKELVERCAAQTGLASVRAVSRFLHIGGAGALTVGKDFNPGDSITFRVGGTFPVDEARVRSFWADEPREPRRRELQCHLCAVVGPVPDRLRKKVKGIPGGKPAGTSIVSANAPAFESYGLKKSHVAPTCQDCGEKLTEALNHLLSDEKYHLTFPNGKVVLWTGEPTPFDWARILGSPDDGDTAAQMRDLESGHGGAAIDEVPLYGAVLTASGGRAVLRDWMESTVGDVRANLGDWFSSQAMVRPQGGESRPLGIHALTGAAGRNLGDTSMQITASLVRGALLGVQPPHALLYHAVRLNRVERKVTRPRAALIKLVLTTGAGGPLRSGAMTSLDPSCRSPGYLCGRLLYALGHAQLAAVRGMRSMFVYRYFCLASSAPAPVFRRLLSAAEPYLLKLKRRHGAVYQVIEAQLESIMGGLEEIPVRLTLEEQGLFALGYYHQRVSLLGEIEERARGSTKEMAAVSHLAAD